jgi:hypothetical protein
MVLREVLPVFRSGTATVAGDTIGGRRHQTPGPASRQARVPTPAGDSHP